MTKSSGRAAARSTPAVSASTTARPRELLLATADSGLTHRVSALAAAAGVELRQVGPSIDRASWSGAALVLLGSDVALASLPATDLPDASNGATGDLGGVAPRRAGVIVVTETSPGEPLWRAAVQVGAEHVVELPAGAQWLAGRIVEAVSDPALGAVIGVVGGRGGAGATTLACALATTAARRGHAVMLLDGDPAGGGLDLVFGAEDCPGLRWPQLVEARGRLRPGQLWQQLPVAEGVRLLAWGREGGAVPAAAVAAVLAAARAESDLVIVDLPRVWDEPAMIAARGCRLIALLVPAELRAVAAARTVLSQCRGVGAEVRLVVRGPAPTGLDPRAVAELLRLPLLADLRPEPGLAGALDRGIAPPLRARGPLERVCRRLLAELAATGPGSR